VTGWQASKSFFLIKGSTEKFTWNPMTHNTVLLWGTNIKLGDNLQSIKGGRGAWCPQKQPKAFDQAPGNEGQE